MNRARSPVSSALALALLVLAPAAAAGPSAAAPGKKPAAPAHPAPASGAAKSPAPGDKPAAPASGGAPSPASAALAPEDDFGGYRLAVFGEKMPVFRQLRDTLKLVVLGDSRADCGIDPGSLLGGKNRTFPEAYNLATPYVDLGFQRLVVDTWILGMPKLEWVVLSLSPRNFNVYWRSDTPGVLAGSRGFRIDRDPARSTLGKPHIPPTSAKGLGGKRANAWGATRLCPTPPVANLADAAAQAQRIKELGQGRFVFDYGKWTMFNDLMAALMGRGVRVLAVFPPMHDTLARAPVADDDGTTDEAYAMLVGLLTDYEKAHPGFYFRDLHQDGKHGYADRDFMDWDHLKPSGRKKFTASLARLLTELGRPPKKQRVKKGAPPAPPSAPALSPPSPGPMVLADVGSKSGKRCTAVAYGTLPGVTAYSDRPLVLADVPPELWGTTLIRTANDDKLRGETDLVSFFPTRPVTVWVAHDPRAPKPGWLMHFTDLKKTLTVGSPLALYRRDYAAEPVVLGPNSAPGQATQQSSMYLVMVAPRP